MSSELLEDSYLILMLALVTVILLDSLLHKDGEKGLTSTVVQRKDKQLLRFELGRDCLALLKLSFLGHNIKVLVILMIIEY